MSVHRGAARSVSYRKRPSGISKHERIVSRDLEGYLLPKKRQLRRVLSPSWQLLLAVAMGWLTVHVASLLLVTGREAGVAKFPGGIGGDEKTEVDARPPYRGFPRPSGEKYLAYFPHSGYHNQRISLENALTLAFMLKRTLLVPPARLGNAVPYISYDKLYQRTIQATKEGLEHCRRATTVLPPECASFWGWTAVSWDYLVDFRPAYQLVPVIDRWDGTYEWLELELGVTEKNIFAVPDERMYQYRLYDSNEDQAPLDKFEARIDIDTLRSFDDYKLIHVGTLFGTSRLRTTLEENGEARSLFRRSMVFRNPLTDGITDAIRDRLGGAAGYYGLHLRVGDGLFMKHAKENAESVLRQLMRDKMHLNGSLVDELLHVKPLVTKRTEIPLPSGTTELAASKAPSRPKGGNSRPQKSNAYKHAPLPALPKIRKPADSPLASSLTCRGRLYEDERYLKLNAPVFLATDSRQPSSDPNLAILFDTLPCLFVLGDFAGRHPTPLNSEPISQLAELDRLVNMDDGVPLAPFLYPIIDMVSAAKGRAIIGTTGSTFSRFAVDVLHQVYHGWNIIERG